MPLLKRMEVPKLLEACIYYFDPEKGFDYANMKPSNFPPITLQPLFAKIYSSLIQNRTYNFILENQFIESNIEK